MCIRDRAQRLSHTIKGVAGNIGAEELQKAGSDLELAIKQEKFKDAQGRIDPFEAALNRIIKSLKGVAEDDKPLEDKKTVVIGDPTELLALMEKLAPHIKKRKPKQCKEVMEDIKK